MSECRPHDYGFQWGPLDITRIASYERGKGKAYILGVATDRHKVEVYASRTGRSVRVWIDGAEVTTAPPTVDPSTTARDETRTP